MAAARRVGVLRAVRMDGARQVTETPSQRVFVSYRREDTRHMAGRLFDRLSERFGELNVFMDVDSIEPGIDFSQAIERAVQKCDVLLALIGRAWLSETDEHGRPRLDDPDDLVVLEIKSALDRDIRVIPVLIDGAAAPRHDELPEGLAPLARRNAIRVDHDTFRSDIGPLLNVLNQTRMDPAGYPLGNIGSGMPIGALVPSCLLKPASRPVSRIA